MLNTVALVEMFLAAQTARGFSPRTVERRRWACGRWSRHLGEVPLNDATVEDVETFLSGYPVLTTRQAVRSDVNQLYRFLVRRGHVARNPVDDVDAPRLRPREPSPIPVDDVLRVIDAARPHVRLMVMLAAYAGLRVSEIAALRADDIDHDNGCLIVRGGKGGKDAAVPLAGELEAELALWPARGRYFPRTSGDVAVDLAVATGDHATIVSGFACTMVCPLPIWSSGAQTSTPRGPRSHRCWNLTAPSA